MWTGPSGISRQHSLLRACVTIPAYRDTDPGPSAAASSCVPSRSTSAPCAGGSGGARPSAGPCGRAGRGGRTGRPTSRRAPCSFSRLLRPQAGQQQIVVQGEILAERAGVALAAAAADQLAVDAAGVVHLGADHVQAAQFGHAVAELDVGAAAGHVRRDGHLAGQAGAGDDVGLGGDVVGVEHLVLDARARSSSLREMFRLVDRAGADQHAAGRRRAVWQISSTTAAHLASAVPKTRSGSRWRMAGRLVGIGSTWQR